MSEALLFYMPLISFLFPSCQLLLLSLSPSPDVPVHGFVPEVFSLELTSSGVHALHRLSLCPDPPDELMLCFPWALCDRCCWNLRELGLSLTNPKQCGWGVSAL